MGEKRAAKTGVSCGVGWGGWGGIRLPLGALEAVFSRSSLFICFDNADQFVGDYIGRRIPLNLFRINSFLCI